MNDKHQFVALTRQLVTGLLREAIGYSVEFEVPYYQGTVGYMVEAPMLWIRHSRFPILFIAYDPFRTAMLLDTIVTQLEIARATEFFALLIVVPTGEGAGNEAEDVRRLLADTVYRYDFVVLDRQALATIIVHNSSHRLIELILQQGIELSNLSPYVVRGPVPEKMFFGREREIKAVSRGLMKADYAIVGGRRIGKSSVLQRLNRLLNNDHGYRAYYVDCEEKFTYQDLFQALFGEPLDRVDPLYVRKLLFRLKGEETARELIFLLDEVDELLALDAKSESPAQLFKTFRALSHEGVCRFVFSGSRTLYRHLRDPRSPFFNFCEDIVLRPLEEKSVAEIVTKPMRQLGIELPEEEALIDRIIDLSSCHPNIAQWLCDKLIKTSNARRITVDDLEKVAADAEYVRHYVQTAWGDATPIEKLISLIVDEPKVDFQQLCQKLTRYGVTDKTLIRDALETLELFSLLKQEKGQFCFGLEQFPRIVRQNEDRDFQIESLLSQTGM